ncbi:MAG: SUMF1/EgtB/PvdO family nonheme iron enzyme [Bacteroidota bacterium]
MRYLSLFFCLLLSVSFVNPTKNLELLPRQGKDFALFFAVDDYHNHADYNNLRNPIKDAKAIAKELEEIYGFEAKVYENPSRTKIFNALREWRSRSFDKDAQLFVFFSGHGEFDDFVSKGYFIPYDNNKIDLTDLGNIVTKIPCEHTLLAIDACYSGTIDQEIAFRGSSRFQRPGVTADTERQNIIQKQLRYKTRLLLTSGEKNRTPDGSNHSPFSNAILKKLRAAHTYGDGLVTFTDLLGEMERISPVPHQGELRGHEQGGFVFVSKEISEQPANNRSTTNPNANSIPTNTGDIPISGNALPGNDPPKADFPNGHQMKLIPSGTFTMGCTSEQKDCDSDEKPLRKVTLDAYWMDVHEVTNEQYARFLNEYGSAKVKNGRYKGQKMIYEYEWGVKKVGSLWQSQSNYEKYPVIYVTWWGANEYSQYYGLRLPTEAEWEYAAREGMIQNKYLYSGSNDLNKVAWYNKTSGRSTQRVMTKKANDIGLFDMSGNVWEWCWDTYGRYMIDDRINPIGAVSTGTTQILRGGSWLGYPTDCRISTRLSDSPGSKDYDIGFRCARTK